MTRLLNLFKNITTPIKVDHLLYMYDPELVPKLCHDLKLVYMELIHDLQVNVFTYGYR